MCPTDPEVSRRSKTRSARRHSVQVQKIEQVEKKQCQYKFKPIEILTEEQIEEIEKASFYILEQYGIEILSEQAADIMREHGVDISADKRYARFDRNLIIETIKTCPERFTFHARNPANNLIIGDDYFMNSFVGSAPNVSDTDKGRRPGNWQDFINLVKLSQQINVNHSTVGHPVEPIDIHPSIRHLEASRAFVTMTDKPFSCYSLNPQINIDAIEVARIVQGVDKDTICQRPSLMSVVNANSPLKYDAAMLDGIITMASHNQIVIITPFTLAGVMAPITKAGAIAQQNAEALAGIAFSQMVKKGAPVVYGGFTSNVDMKSGAPAFGTPEYVQCTLAGGQFARRYKIPYRSSNTNAANIVDVQATYESQMSLWACMLSSTNVLKHALGWMEGGLVTSYEKVIVDMEMLQQMQRICDDFEVSEETLALDAIKEAGHGGHFLGTQHTQQRYKDAFYAPILSDWSNYENWHNAGAKTATQRANETWKKLLNEYQKPPIDEAIEEELNDFIDKRKKEGGIKTDF